MLKSSTSKSAKKRVKVKDLPTAETKLTGKEMKKVKGGFSAEDIWDVAGVKGSGVKVLDSGGSGSFDQVKAKK